MLSSPHFSSLLMSGREGGNQCSIADGRRLWHRSTQDWCQPLITWLRLPPEPLHDCMLTPIAGNPSWHCTVTHEYRATSNEKRTVTHEYRAVMHEYRSLGNEKCTNMHEYRDIMHEYRAVIHEYRADMHEYRAVMHEYRYLGNEKCTNIEPLWTKIGIAVIAMYFIRFLVYFMASVIYMVYQFV